MVKFFRPLIALLTLPAIAFLVIWGSGQYVAVMTGSHRFTDQNTIATTKVAVVFGAGIIQSRGEVGTVLKGRMDAAIALYKAGKVDHLILSGDNTQSNYDEVTPMLKYAQEHGVPSEDMITDRAGTSTYDTCYRLKNTFKETSATLVTNEYHLPRAVYTCRQLGIDAIGLGTPNYAGYEDNKNQRESLATVKMLIDLYVAPPPSPTP